MAEPDAAIRTIADVQREDAEFRAAAEADVFDAEVEAAALRDLMSGTAAAQACIEAHGGVLAKLSTFVDDKSVGSLQSYTYLESEVNLDFEAGVSNITAYNALHKDLAPKKGDPPKVAMRVEDMKAYSNLNGLLAIGAGLNTPESLAKISEACMKAKSSTPPSFD